jgi:hypothetical protein
MAVAVVDPVQVLEEQVAAARLVREQRLDFLQRLGIDRAAFRPRAHLRRPYHGEYYPAVPAPRFLTAVKRAGDHSHALSLAPNLATIVLFFGTTAAA